jgi:hypothetical protein
LRWPKLPYLARASPSPLRVNGSLAALVHPTGPWRPQYPQATAPSGFRCLIPAAPAVPAAAANQQNDQYDDEKRGGVHGFDPYPFYPFLCQTAPARRGGRGVGAIWGSAEGAALRRFGCEWITPSWDALSSFAHPTCQASAEVCFGCQTRTSSLGPHVRFRRVQTVVRVRAALHHTTPCSRPHNTSRRHEASIAG